MKRFRSFSCFDRQAPLSPSPIRGAHSEFQPVGLIIRLLRPRLDPGPTECPDDVAKETRGWSHGNNDGLIQIKLRLAAAVNHSVTLNRESLILDCCCQSAVM